MRKGSVVGGRYEISDPIGSGPVADVYLAQDRVLARSVALKVLRAGSGARAKAGFKQAATKAAKLSHPNIAAVYDTGEVGSGRSSRPFLVTELCVSTDPPAGRWDVADVATLGAGVGRALEHAHSMGVAHGNLVRPNVFRASDGTVKVTDFGLSSSTQELPATAEADLRALGALMFELLTGRDPEDPPSSPRAIRAGIPKAIEAAVMRALEAAEGYSARDLVRAIDGMRDAGSDAPLPAPLEGAPGWDARWTIPVTILILVAITAVVLVPRTFDSGNPRRRGEAVPDEATVIEVRRVRDFDPGGDGEEHSELTGLAADGDPATAWRSESYLGTLAQVKPDHPGVGLIFDLGRPAAVDRVQIESPTPAYSFELLQASRLAPDEASWAPVATLERASRVVDMDAFETVTARYWLLWITSLPGGGGGRVEIAEVSFFGS